MEWPEKTLDNFVENYDHSIRNRFLAEIANGSTKFIFNGPDGTGKRFLAEAFADDRKYDFELINLYLVESDDAQSVYDAFSARIYNAGTNKSLLANGRKVLYIEDADKVIKTNPFLFKKLADMEDPIVIFRSESGSIFRSENKRFLDAYKIINFYRLNDSAMRIFVKKVAAKNSISIDSKSVDVIVGNAGGNINNAFTDLETFKLLGSVKYVERSRDIDIFSKLSSIIGGKAGFDTEFLSTDYDAKILEMWLATNLPRRVGSKALSETFDVLSFSDVLMGKVRAQNWEYMKYISSLLFGGVSAFSDGSLAGSFSTPVWKDYFSARV